MPVPETVGLELKFEEIWRLVENPSVGIIGLYGMGGIGKTTLLKMIHNKIWRTRDYVLIWVDRSEQDPVKAVHEAVRKKFEISEEFWKNKSEKDNEAVWTYLRSEKFILLLDDVGGQWHYHLLEEIGIPLTVNRNQSKIIFTTRSKEICDRMGAESIEVECLPLESAQELFRLCVGQPTLNSHPAIPELADEAAKACNGLPLLLITVGRAMSRRNTYRNWKLEVEKLKERLTKIPDVEAQVFSVLKVSYDTLSTDIHRQCFLYFPLFPEGHHIKKQELIELWIAEGLLDGCKDIFDAREQGEEIISSLKLASLLESGMSEEFIKMHAVIRAMAFWLAAGVEGEAEDRILADAEALEFPKWENAKRISLWDSCINSLPHIPSCSHLTTLILRAPSLKNVPGGFFRSMSSLIVLDLSHNDGLSYLPEDIGELHSLLYLNLSGTSIKYLPAEVQNLKNLRILITENYLMKIEHGVITGMRSLIVFRMLVNPSVYSLYDEASVLEELECLVQIKEVSMSLSSAWAMKKLSDSYKLRRCIKQLKLVKFRGQDSRSLFLKNMEHLERLELWHCPYLRTVEVDKENLELFGQESFQNLRVVSILNCDIKNAAWLIYAPNIRTMTLNKCQEISEVVIVSDNFGQDNLFSNLRELL